MVKLVFALTNTSIYIKTYKYNIKIPTKCRKINIIVNIMYKIDKIITKYKHNFFIYKINILYIYKYRFILCFYLYYNKFYTKLGKYTTNIKWKWLQRFKIKKYYYQTPMRMKFSKKKTSKRMLVKKQVFLVWILFSIVFNWYLHMWKCFMC